MKDRELTSKEVAEIQLNYPPGTRILLNHMEDQWAVPSGTRGTVEHIHVDASRHDPKTLRNIVNIMASKEDLLYKTLKVNIDREYYCQKADLRFLDDVNLKRPKSMSEFESLWYNGASGRHTHYHSSRYHALNLHSVFSKGTIEFRMFNSTLHAEKQKLERAILRACPFQFASAQVQTQGEAINSMPKQTNINIE